MTPVENVFNDEYETYDSVGYTLSQGYTMGDIDLAVQAYGEKLIQNTTLDYYLSKIPAAWRENIPELKLHRREVQAQGVMYYDFAYCDVSIEPVLEEGMVVVKPRVQEVALWQWLNQCCPFEDFLAIGDELQRMMYNEIYHFIERYIVLKGEHICPHCGEAFAEQDALCGNCGKLL